MVRVASSSADNAKFRLHPKPRFSATAIRAVLLILQPCHESSWVWNILRRGQSHGVWKALFGETDDVERADTPAPSDEPAAEAKLTLMYFLLFTFWLRLQLCVLCLWLFWWWLWFLLGFSCWVCNGEKRDGLMIQSKTANLCQEQPTQKSPLSMAATQLLNTETTMYPDVKQALVTLSRQEEVRVVYINVGPGCGKSHLALKLMQALCLCLQIVFFFPTSQKHRLGFFPTPKTDLCA